VLQLTVINARVRKSEWLWSEGNNSTVEPSWNPPLWSQISQESVGDIAECWSKPITDAVQNGHM